MSVTGRPKTYTDQLVENWLKSASTDALKDKVAELDAQTRGDLSPRDTETRAQLLAMARKELVARTTG